MKALTNAGPNSETRMPKGMDDTWGAQWTVHHTGLGGVYFAVAECSGMLDKSGIIPFVWAEFTILNAPAGGQDVDIPFSDITKYIDGKFSNIATVSGVDATSPDSHGKTISMKFGVKSGIAPHDWLTNFGLHADIYQWVSRAGWTNMKVQYH